MSIKKRTRVATFIDGRIEELKGVKSQKDIAEIVGYNTPNMITMIKLGDTKVALDRVALLAKALEVDPANLFKLAMEQFYSPETVKTIFAYFGEIVSANESEIIGAIRKASDNSDPALTAQVREGLHKIFTP